MRRILTWALVPAAAFASMSSPADAQSGRRARAYPPAYQGSRPTAPPRSYERPASGGAIQWNTPNGAGNLGGPGAGGSGGGGGG